MNRSWLYCPGNKPRKIKNVGIYGSDGIVLDLEDSVAESEKDEARLLVAEALKQFDFGSVTVAVRINSLATSYWEDDLKAVLEAGCTNIRLPKVETAEELIGISGLIDKEMKSLDSEARAISLQAILETPRGVLNAASIAQATPRLSGLSFGAEDYCTSMGISRTAADFALDFPRSMIACAASAAGIEAWDTVWADYSDSEGLKDDALRARKLGFTGKSVIHPDQIEIVNRVFSPTEQDIAWAMKIDAATADTDSEEAFSLDGSMIDTPVIKRARRILSSRFNGNA